MIIIYASNVDRVRDFMVGHIHKDTDALFGNITNYLRRNDTLTIPGNVNIKRINFTYFEDLISGCILEMLDIKK